MRSVLHEAFAILFSDFFFYKNMLRVLVEAIQMSSHNICFYKEVDKSTLIVCLFVCVEVLRPSQPNGVMSSAVSYLAFTGQA